MTRFFCFCFLTAIHAALLFPACAAHAETPVFADCPADRKAEDCLIDHAIENFDFSSIKTNAQEQKAERVLFAIVRHASPQQADALVSRLALTPEQLFTPEQTIYKTVPEKISLFGLFDFEYKRRKQEIIPQRDALLKFYPLLLAAAGRTDDVIRLIQALSANPRYTPQPDAKPPQIEPIALAALVRRDWKTAERLIKETKHLSFHKPAATPAYRQAPQQPPWESLADRIIPAALLDGRFATAFDLSGLKDVAAGMRLYKRHRAVLAYARRAEDPAVYAHYAAFCDALFATVRKAREEETPVLYDDALEKLLDAECLRDNGDMALAVPLYPRDRTPERDARPDKASLDERLHAQQGAHQFLAALAANGVPLAGEALETLVFIDPYIAADACRKHGDEKCVGFVADIVLGHVITPKMSAQEMKRLPYRIQSIATTSTPTALPESFQEISPPRVLSPDLPDWPRFLKYNHERLRREFGLLPMLPAPALPQEPPLLRTALKNTARCADKKIYPAAIDYIGCITHILYSSERVHYFGARQKIWDDLMLYMIDPYSPPEDTVQILRRQITAP